MQELSLQDRIDRLEAIEEIKQIKARYCRFVDTKDWVGFAGLFTEDLVIDFGESTSSPRSRDEFVAAAARHFEKNLSIHQVHLGEVEIIDNTHARAVWPMYDLVEKTSDDSEYVSHTGWGHYTEEYRKENGHWRCSRTQLTRLKRVVLGD
ncbi:nuclear transport factor 2 family protein [Rhodococcus sp. CX]|uniref:nuclear transport factor 2 family protein n=1 Tax=Rhodococcus sp. CX TaxID=2789880 RepID=UPI001E3E946B|nr:nuclear transport factor 2 family protein [Rhodococcus sp. CX]